MIKERLDSAQMTFVGNTSLKIDDIMPLWSPKSENSKLEENEILFDFKVEFTSNKL